MGKRWGSRFEFPNCDFEVAGFMGKERAFPQSVGRLFYGKADGAESCRCATRPVLRTRPGHPHTAAESCGIHAVTARMSPAARRREWTGRAIFVGRGLFTFAGDC